MFREKKFIRKTTKFERRSMMAPDMAAIRNSTERIEDRPPKYLDLGMEKLNLQQELRNVGKELFLDLRDKYYRFKGGGDPMPGLAGLLYYVCRITGNRLRREIIANVFGTNKEMVTVGYHEIRSYLQDKRMSIKI